MASSRVSNAPPTRTSDEKPSEPETATRVVEDEVDPTGKGDKQKVPKEKVEQASMRQLFRFATPFDWFLLTIAFLASLGCGACMPLVLYLFAGSIEEAGRASSGAFDQDSLTRQSILLVVVGVALWFGTAVYMALTDIPKVRMMARYRKEYVRSVIRQDIGWFDIQNPSELAPAIGAAMSTIEDGLSQKVMQLFENAGTGVGCLVLSFVFNPYVSLVVLATFPVIGLAAGLLQYTQTSSIKKIQSAYAQAGGRANEALCSMRTIASFGLEERTARLYESGLKAAERAGVTAAVLGGFALSLFMASMNLMLGAGLLFGGLLLANEQRGSAFTYYTEDQNGNPENYCVIDCGNQYNSFDLVPETFNVSCDAASWRGVDGFLPFKMTCATADVFSQDNGVLAIFGVSNKEEFEEVVNDRGGYFPCNWPWIASSVLIALLSVQTGAQQLGLIGQNLSPLAKARQAAVKIIKTIERVPEIDVFSTEGKQLPSVRGEVEVRDVEFSYPSAPGVQVCNGYSLHVPAGKVVALCGPSGSGKSTIISLLERFYDPSSGSVMFDGVDVKTLNVSWLRQQMGLVGQEPVLFVGTVFENISYGKVDGATQQEVEEAAKMANAHNFITQKLPSGYDTQVGQGGSKLSGGQKQRVAIARAIVRKPSVLLLDEATSALDTASERVVQAALDSLMAQQKRTTITIAHRLSTIRNADKIAVVFNGKVEEEGTYNQLLAIGETGRFYGLAQKQEAERTKRKHTYLEESTQLGAEPTLAAGSLAAKSAFDPEDPTESAFADPDHPVEAVQIASAVAIVEEDMKSSKRSGAVLSEAPKPKVKGVFSRLNSLQDRGDCTYFILGSLLAAIDGCINPLTGFFFCKLLLIFYEPDPADVAEGSIIWSLVYIAVGIIAVLVVTAEMACFGIPGQHLTTNLRSLCMRTLLKQDIGYFDSEKNSAGELTSFLEEKVTLIQSMNGEKIGMIFRTLFTLISGLVLVFWFGYWQLSLVMLAAVPIIALSMAVQMMLMLGVQKQGAEKTGAKDEKSAASLVGEVIIGMRTVASFGAERRFYEMYCEQVDDMTTKGRWAAIVGGFAAGLAKGLPLMVFGIVFWYGGTLVADDLNGLQSACTWGREQYDEFCGTEAQIGTEECEKAEEDYRRACELNEDFCFAGDTDFLFRFMVPCMVIFFMAMGIGMMSSTATDAKKAKKAVEDLFARLERESPIDPTDPSGATPESCEGEIDIQDVVFAYPTRLDHTICNGYSLHVAAGQLVALCGPSGSGKSTCISLLERFYDPQSGAVMLDGVDIKTLNVSWLRQQMGLVGQEPVLFVGTVFDNISYGKKEAATQQEVEEAAKMANAHNFITQSLHEGYQTQVGIRGSMLSGGQKQRVAIARAIIRKPAILLLDEATSALDNESEQIVQAALDDVVQQQKKITGRGRTTITIAHRLSTIRDADKIAVVHRGKVLEEGTHEELMEKRAAYHELVEAQHQ